MYKLLIENIRSWRRVSQFNRKFKSKISHRAILRCADPKLIQLEKNVQISIGTLVILEQHNKNETTLLNVGENTYIGEYNNIRIVDSVIEIGKNCMISQFVSLISINHSMEKNKLLISSGLDYSKRNIFIRDDVWIGCNSVILPGVEIGEGAIIGAGSVVNCNIEPYAVFAGNPAKFIKYRK